LVSEVFYWLLNMSIYATIVGCIVVLLGKIKKIPRWIVCLLWIIPFLRMCIPIGMNSRFSFMTLLSKYTTKTIVVYEVRENYSMMNSVVAADTYFPITYKVNLVKDIFQVASIVWIVISITLMFVMLLIYGVTKWKLRKSYHLCDNIYLSDRVSSPATYGIKRPKIIIPKTYESMDLRYVLMHENSHIKRKDNVWRMIGIISACIHWFNPFIWFFLKQFLINLELACDEHVLSKCGEKEKKEYATALLDCAESKNLFASSFSGTKARVRIERILSYQKLSAFSTFCLMILVLIIGYTLLTNAT